MDSVLDLFLGDRVYDENGKLIKRDFGLKNILAIAVVVFLGYSLMGKSFSVPTLSGKKKGKKMKGGGLIDDFIELLLFIGFVILPLCAVCVGIVYLIYSVTKSIVATVIISIIMVGGLSKKFFFDKAT